MVETSRLRIRFDGTNPERVTELVFKDYSPTVNLRGETEAENSPEWFGEVIRGIWEVTGFIYPQTLLSRSWTARPLDSGRLQIAIDSRSLGEPPVATNYTFYAGAPFFQIDRTIRFSQQPQTNSFQPYVARVTPLVNFSSYRYRNVRDSLMTGRFCPFGCDMHDWDKRWAEDVGHGIAVTIMYASENDPNLSLIVDYDDGSNASWCAPLVAYAHRSHDVHYRCLVMLSTHPDDVAQIDSVYRWFDASRQAPASPPPLMASQAEQTSSVAARGMPAETLSVYHELLEHDAYDEAGLMAWRQILRVESAAPVDSTALAHALGLYIDAMHDSQRTFYRQSLVENAALLEKRLHGPLDPRYSAALRRLAWDRGDQGLANALDPAREALAIAERSRAPALETANDLSALARVTYSIDDTAQARSLYERAITVRGHAIPCDSIALAGDLAQLADILVDEGDAAGARRLYAQALPVLERLAPRRPATIDAEDAYARFLLDHDDYSDARLHAERAARAAERLPASYGYAGWQGLRHYAEFLQAAGDYTSARRVYEGLLTRAGESPWPTVGREIHAMGDLARLDGDDARALSLYERALTIYRSHSESRAKVPGCERDIAATLLDLGDVAGARDTLARALSEQERGLAPDHPEIARSLELMATIRQQYDELPGARALLERAQAITVKHYGTAHSELARIFSQQGELALASGASHDAESRFRQALAIEQNVLGPDHPRVAALWDALAGALERQGLADSALALQDQALAIWRTRSGPTSPDLARSLYRRACLVAELGRSEEAIEFALEAERIGREQLSLSLRGLAERAALRYAVVRPAGLGLAVHLAVARHAGGRVPEQLFDALIRTRALVLDEVARRRRQLTRRDDPTTMELASAMSSARQRLVHLIVRGPESKAASHYRNLITAAQAAAERAEAVLAEHDVSFREDRVRAQIGFAEVEAALPESNALVAYVRYAWPDSMNRTGVRQERESYAAFVITHGTPGPRLVPLGDAEHVEGLVNRWREAVQDPAQGTRYRAAGAALRQRVWDPLGIPEGTGRVFVVPDGALGLVALQTLPDEHSGYLLESAPLMSYLTTERDLVPAERTGPLGAGLLAMGGCAFDELPDGVAVPFATREPASDGHGPDGESRGDRFACGGYSDLHFRPLPGSAAEVRQIAALWRGAAKEAVRFGSDSLGSVTELTRAAASKAAFMRLAPRYRMIHLATHGFFLAGDCQPQGNDARGVSALAPAENPAPPVVENPLLLSGLALSGANRSPDMSDGGNDGILTSEEIAALDLSGVDWAVLSACGTGTGEVRAGEGVLGLRRALQVAGAWNLIASLWSIGDETTRAWMRALYEARLSGCRGAAEATRTASLDILRDRRARGLSTHPFYWGGFIAIEREAMPEHATVGVAVH